MADEHNLPSVDTHIANVDTRYTYMFTFLYHFPYLTAQRAISRFHNFLADYTI